MNTRVPGRGRLLASLRALLRRIERFAEHRALTSDETRWAARLADRLEAAFTEAHADAGARASLAAAERRTTISRKNAAPEGLAGGRP